MHLTAGRTQNEEDDPELLVGGYCLIFYVNCGILGTIAFDRTARQG